MSLREFLVLLFGVAAIVAGCWFAWNDDDQRCNALPPPTWCH